VDIFRLFFARLFGTLANARSTVPFASQCEPRDAIALKAPNQITAPLDVEPLPKFAADLFFAQISVEQGGVAGFDRLIFRQFSPEILLDVVSDQHEAAVFR
jgi:hypothetical protein